MYYMFFGLFGFLILCRKFFFIYRRREGEREKEGGMEEREERLKEGREGGRKRGSGRRDFFWICS